MSEFEEMNEQATPQGKKKKKGNGLGIVLFFTILSAACFALTLLTNDGFGNILLLLVGIVEFLFAFVISKIFQYRERYTCPECGCRREHHRELLRTTDKLDTYTESEKITYTHHYEDTYICPDCGTTKTERLQKSGGYVSYNKKTGYTGDHRIHPNEF